MGCLDCNVVFLTAFAGEGQTEQEKQVGND